MTKLFKYPRTPHLPWSNATRDDSKLNSVDHFEGKHVYITEKLDGECTTMYRDYIHARSFDSLTNFTRSWVQNFHKQVAHNIPEGWRVVGENMWAEHSLRYEKLKSYFYPFAVYDDNNYCLSYGDMLIYLRTEFYKDLHLQWVLPTTPTVIYRSEFCKFGIEAIEINPLKEEGYVVRTEDGFHYDDFTKNVAKYVRNDHVKTDDDWLKNAKRNGGLYTF